MLTAQRTTIKLRTSPAPRVFGDELFPAVGGLITCRVCERVETVCVGHPALLCGACLVDLTATARHVAATYAAALAFFLDASAALAAAVETSTERVWWGRVEAARGAVDFDPALFAQAWERAKRGGGERARLCALWEACDKEATRLAPLNAWHAAAEHELRAARAALGDPHEV